MTHEKHEVLLRMKAIELLAYWQGRVVTNHLVDWFGVSRQQASQDIKRYLEDHNPGAMIHSRSARGYIPTDVFKPVLTKGRVNDYLDLITSVSGEPYEGTIESTEFLSAVDLPDRAVKPEVLREVLKACKWGYPILISYTSMNNPTPHDRVISPHRVVYSGFRWHIRAFCHLRQSYRDFVISRIKAIPMRNDQSYVSDEQDHLWHEEIEVSLIPNPNLSRSQQQLVMDDFGMEKGSLKVISRKALIHYAIQRYQAGLSEDELLDCTRYPVVVSEQSRKMISSYLFDGAGDGN